MTAAVVNEIVESRNELGHQEGSGHRPGPAQDRPAVLKWGTGLVIAGVAAQLFKAFFQ